MHAFEAILLMLLVAAFLRGVADRFAVPYPALLALVGTVLALLHIELPFHIPPQLALVLFVAPVLLDAAYDMSIRDLKRSWRAVSGLVLFAVGLTTAAVAVVAHALVPGLSWSAAIALGAIVSPPDASAATAVLRQVKLPHRLAVILEGESLLNDASALLIYRLAVTVAVTHHDLSFGDIAPAFLLSTLGSLVAGPLLAQAWRIVTAKVTDVTTSIILQFVSTFGVWLIAEALSLSPIVTVVTYAMAVARWAPARTPAQIRVPAYAVWDTVTAVVTALAFLFIGLELGPIIARASIGDVDRAIGFASIILVTVIVVRMAWVLFNNLMMRWLKWRGGVDLPPGKQSPSWQGSAVLAWSGMRGVVTVATALALPAGFPQRNLLLFTAFFVTLGTLLIQGLTLTPLLKWLQLDDDHPVDREVRAARVAMADTSLAALKGHDGEYVELLRHELEVERRTADEAKDGDGRAVFEGKQLHAELLKLRRDCLLKLRDNGTIGDDAYHRLEEELDFADIATAQRT